MVNLPATQNFAITDTTDTTDTTKVMLESIQMSTEESKRVKFSRVVMVDKFTIWHNYFSIVHKEE